jgi:hypothetical protein
LIATTLPLARDVVTGRLAAALAVASFAALAFTRVDAAWVILGAAATGLVAGLAG